MQRRGALAVLAVHDDERQRRDVLQVPLAERALPFDDVELPICEGIARREALVHVPVDLAARCAPLRVEVEDRHLPGHGVSFELGNVLAGLREPDDIGVLRQVRQRLEREIGMTLQTLRLRHAVRRAPVARALELRDELRMMDRARALGHLVLA